MPTRRPVCLHTYDSSENNLDDVILLWILMAVHRHTYQPRDSDLRGEWVEILVFRLANWIETELCWFYYYVYYYEFNCRDAACSHCVTLILINDSIHHHHISNLADDVDGNQVIWAPFLKPDDSISDGYCFTETAMSSGVKFSNGIQVEWTVRRLHGNTKYKTNFKSSEKPKNQVKRHRNSHANTETPNPICDGSVFCARARSSFSQVRMHAARCIVVHTASEAKERREKFREFAKR